MSKLSKNSSNDFPSHVDPSLLQGTSALPPQPHVVKRILARLECDFSLSVPVQNATSPSSAAAFPMSSPSRSSVASSSGSGIGLAETSPGVVPRLPSTPDRPITVGVRAEVLSASFVDGFDEELDDDEIDDLLCNDDEITESKKHQEKISNEIEAKKTKRERTAEANEKRKAQREEKKRKAAEARANSRLAEKKAVTDNSQSSGSSTKKTRKSPVKKKTAGTAKKNAGSKAERKDDEGAPLVNGLTFRAPKRRRKRKAAPAAARRSTQVKSTKCGDKHEKATKKSNSTNAEKGSLKKKRKLEHSDDECDMVDDQDVGAVSSRKSKRPQSSSSSKKKTSAVASTDVASHGDENSEHGDGVSIDEDASFVDQIRHEEVEEYISTSAMSNE